MENIYWGVHSALTDHASPSIMIVGDSWFWYPIDNLATEISAALPDETLLAIGFSGAEAREWQSRFRKSIDFGFKMYASGVQALILSGGGNDIAGMADFLAVIADDCSGARTVEDCFRPGQPQALLAQVMDAYRDVILRFRAYNSSAPVLMHNYDYAWPTGKGLFGPADWLRAPMEEANVPPGLRRELFRYIVDRLHQEQQELSLDPRLGKLVAIRSAGTLPEETSGIKQWWANELHPTPHGFRRIANEAFVPVLRTLLPNYAHPQLDDDAAPMHV